MLLLSFVFEYITVCLVLVFFLFTFILCFKIANYIATDWFYSIKSIFKKLIKALRKKDRKEVTE